ncbi:hypothetical protein IIB50_00875 [Patescibacteria group bacterium]|nr:hypothetical protein [Patescibacteria group bacterium]
MDAREDLFFFIILLIGLWIAWVATGGPGRADDSKPFLGSGDVSAPSEISQADPAIKDIEESSPYAGMVTFTGDRSGPRKKLADEEYITLRASRNNSENIRISDWYIESLITKRRVRIGGASSLPRSGAVNRETPIFLPPSEKVIITTGKSPTGISFRTNKCTGYFEQFQDFTPRLDRSCPYPEDELIDFSSIPATDDACFDFVEDLSRCEAVLETLPLTMSPQCNQFITKNLNYNGCVANHRNDADFFEDEWRIFLKRENELWRERRETLHLLDENGKIVDTYSY